MQGQAVAQMASQLPINTVTKTTNSTNSSTNAKSNFSFQKEFQNAAENIVEDNTGKVIEDGSNITENNTSILSVLASLGMPNLTVNNLNAVADQSNDSKDSIAVNDVQAIVKSQNNLPLNFESIQNVVQNNNIKGQVNIGVELSLKGEETNGQTNNILSGTTATNEIIPASDNELVTVPKNDLTTSSVQMNTVIEPQKNVNLINVKNSVVNNNIEVQEQNIIPKSNINNAVNNTVNNVALSDEKVIETSANTNNPIITTVDSNVLKADVNNTKDKVSKTSENLVIDDTDAVLSDNKSLDVKPQSKAQEQDESSRQSKNSFNMMTEPSKPEQKNTESTVKNELFTHNIDLATKNHVVKGTETVDKILTTAEKMDIPNQIIQQTKIIKGIEDTQMVIKLKPEHLGELTLKFVLDKGEVSASFHSDNQQVRNIIESSLVQLKQELSDQGIKISHMGVYAGLGDLLSNGQQEQRQNQQTKFKNRKVDLADFEDEIDKVNGIKDVLSEDAVDYRI